MAQAKPKSQISGASAAAEFFPLDQVKPGMRGVGWTVVQGSEPEKFECEILGVLKGFQNPNRNAVIIKLLGEKYQHIGIFQGMSGSPVYIDGKLLGAVAFGFQFARDPIGGVTPIQEMVDIFEQREQKSENPSAAPRSFSFSEIAFNENSREYAKFVNSFNQQTGQTAVPVSAPGAPVLMPIATPLAISGVPSEVIARFAPQFQAMGLTPVAGVASAARIEQMKKAGAETLRPGSTIVVPLVRGDYSLAAAGTVTYRDGNRIYAFGHPFLSLGVADMPMNEGEVVTVLPNEAISFKLAAPTAMVGAIRGDRSTGIYGELGVAPRMIPVEINLRTSRGVSQPYQFEIVSDRFLSPILMQLTTMATIASSERTIGDSTLQVRTRIALKGQPEISLENRLSASANTPLAAAFSVSQPVNALFNSGFSDLAVEKIVIDIDSKDSRNTGKLDRLWINRTEVRRGETIEVVAFARTENGSEYIERIPVTIPADAPPGQLQLMVGDGTAVQAAEPRVGFTPKSLNQLVRELNRIRKADRLYVRLSRSETGAVINNEELPSLPPSVLATLGSDRTAGGYSLTRSVTLFEKELAPAEFVISGQRTLTINVVEK
ncbi:MAG TPA: SpoIVB peptidase S55 domain-containing protein [Blastocatellia bacterium]|nr:SpoIVB peptidase S55 domain-containing protein [Blastocatellia bacterium]